MFAVCLEGGVNIIVVVVVVVVGTADTRLFITDTHQYAVQVCVCMLHVNQVLHVHQVLPVDLSLARDKHLICCKRLPLSLLPSPLSASLFLSYCAICVNPFG